MSFAIVYFFEYRYFRSIKKAPSQYENISLGRTICPWYHLISQQTAPNRLKCCALIAPGNGGGHRSPLLVILETKSFRRDRSRVTILGVRLEALSAAAPSLYHRRRPEPNPDQRVWCVWHWVEINPNDNRFSPDCQAHFREFFTGFFAKNRRNTQNREISSQPVDSAG